MGTGASNENINVISYQSFDEDLADDYVKNPLVPNANTCWLIVSSLEKYKRTKWAQNNVSLKANSYGALKSDDFDKKPSTDSSELGESLSKEKSNLQSTIMKKPIDHSRY